MMINSILRDGDQELSSMSICSSNPAVIQYCLGCTARRIPGYRLPNRKKQVKLPIQKKKQLKQNKMNILGCSGHIPDTYNHYCISICNYVTLQYATMHVLSELEKMLLHTLELKIVFL